ncbi:uncharacterized protein LOC108627954 isoform X2 [Ceratina calcarata]|uniref:Uncharacterized protein LOC108627954 isoform X2 n=1 Tax=Ceratina calcarata TaxID=156304 RepID=A0AAJ7S6N0_9HYME|nr:uncharacterized protein LOC108627954 isoform X2 [Ceratina calcarata]
MDSKEKRLLLKSRIVALNERGWSNRHIARELNCSLTTVKTYVARFRDMGEEGLIDWRKYNFGKRKTSPEEDNAIVGLMKKVPSASASSVPAILDLRVNAETVRNRLREAGFHRRRLWRKRKTWNVNSKEEHKILNNDLVEHEKTMKTGNSPAEDSGDIQDQDHSERVVEVEELPEKN